MYQAFQAMMLQHAPEVLNRTRIIRAPSAVGLGEIASESVDFVFIDGAHDFASVTLDIMNARRILKPGGVLSGHDFCWGNSVVQAVKSELLFKRGGKGYTLYPWPVSRPGWEEGCCSVWIAK
jgi:predicted O-methyltransferase YrrM